MSKSNGDERPHCVLRRNVMIETYTTEVIEPCNIMYDPRVYRGSVIAHRRNEILRIKRELDEKKQRERAQAKMLRYIV
ncbi:hypothetical protein AB6A40_010438 [Gnathostoma spinigerum]|uniref:Uncharacterized protein n=1 Tax=Gnathostoma spinigerum TaxID=75299 RepID=A0ABD6EUT1_9BILA